MNLIILFFLLLLKEIKGKSEEYYDCMYPEKTVQSPSHCTSIIIPYSDGYKCCSMKITYEGNMTYNCLPLENKYTKNKEILEEYISKRSLNNFFSISGGQMEIDCGENKIITKNYEKLSNEYTICYNGHINGAENENDCIENDIPVEEKSKCCFIETSKIKNNQTISDKRCYIIKDEYFVGGQKLSNYLLDELKLKSLDQINNLNITINCKNYEVFNFPNKPDTIDNNGTTPGTKNKPNGLNKWVIVAIIIIIILIIAVVIFFILCNKKKCNLLKR
jgi:hypothetical protein